MSSISFLLFVVLSLLLMMSLIIYKPLNLNTHNDKCVFGSRCPNCVNGDIKLKVNDRVAPSNGWRHGSQHGGMNIGTVIKEMENGWFLVRWKSGSKNVYADIDIVLVDINCIKTCQL